MTFIAKRIDRTHSIELNAPPETVFPLFTPLGEKKWVDGWEPRMLYPTSGEAMKGTVFITQQPGEADTIWNMLNYSPENFRVKYARVTPGSRFGIVEVHCEKLGSDHSRVQVSYIFTALSEAGNDFISNFSETHYRAYIDSWKTQIHSYLERNMLKQK